MVTGALPMSISPGESYIVSAVAMWFCSAAARVTILKVEPGAYSAWVARLNSSEESLPPSAAAVSSSS